MKILQTNNLTGITEEIEVEECVTQEYINSLKPQEPTESERLESLEMLMLDVLWGGF